jgi:hypothetical protein
MLCIDSSACLLQEGGQNYQAAFDHLQSVTCLHDAEKTCMIVLCDAKCSVQTARLQHSLQELSDAMTALFSPWDFTNFNLGMPLRA